MKLTIASPEKTKNFIIEWIQLITGTGAITILPHHAEQIMSLKSNQSIKFKETNGLEQVFSLTNGLVEVTPDEVIILTTFLP